VHVETEPHINEPPGTPQVADGLAEQEFPGYLVEEVVSCAKQVSAKGESTTVTSPMLRLLKFDHVIISIAWHIC